MLATRTWAVVALLTTMLIWGTSAIFLRTTALALSADNALALRYIMMVVLVAAGLAIGGHWRIARADWANLALTAVGMFCSGWFFIQGFARVPAGLGTVITMVEPIIIALLFFLVLREPLSPRLWLGLAVSVAGAIVLFLPDLATSVQQPIDLLGVTYLLIACTGWGLFTIGAKPLMARYTSFTITAWSLLLSAPVVLPLASKPYAELFRTTPAASWLEIFYLALFNTIIGAVLWNYGTRHLPGAVAGSFLYLIPVIAVVAGHFWLGEPITFYLVSGGIIMLAGVVIAQSGTKVH